MSAWGGPRGTVDIDFLVLRDDMDKVDLIMRGLGYECRYKTENVSQYLSPLEIFGEVDFLHAFRSASVRMLERSVERRVFEGAALIKVLRIEDLIGLKVQAVANDKRREVFDMTDIEVLMKRHGNELDWPLIEEYFALFGFHKLFEELKEKYGCHQ